MSLHPAFIVGLVAAGGSMLLFMALVFSSGGFAKSNQFRVLGELFSGKHGGAKRGLTILALIGILFGSCSLFGGVAAGDRARADRCDAYCKKGGHARGVIGATRASATPPSSSGAPPARRPPRVACHCEGGPGAPTEMPADDVPGR